MKKITFLWVVQVLLSLNVYAQEIGYNKKDFEAIKSRPLIVMLETESDVVINRLKKTGKENKIAEYQALVKKHNENLRSIFTKYCSIGTRIEFKSKAGIDSLGKTKDYAIASYRTLEFTPGKPNEIEGNPDGEYYWLDWNPDRWNSNGTTERDYLYGFSVFEIRLSEYYPKQNFLAFYVSMVGHVFPRASDILYNIISANGFFADKEDSKNGPVTTDPGLKNKTLLIPKSLLSPDLSVQGIAASYPYKYEVVEDSVYESRILTVPEDYLFFFIQPIIVSTMGNGQINAYDRSPYYYMHYAINPTAKKRTFSAFYSEGPTREDIKGSRAMNRNKFMTPESLKGLLENRFGK